MNKTYLALGSNLGDRKQNLDKARERLGAKITLQLCSSLYDTAPLGNTNQPRFLNMVCSGETKLSPMELLNFIKGIEKEMGRKPGPVNSPRPIDIDILFFNGMEISTSELVIPHPRLTERVFVLLPLAEIAHGFRHPVTHKSAREMLAELSGSSQDVIKWDEEV